MSTKRLFYAIDLSDDVLDELQALQDEFREHLSGGMRVRWTPRENMHLTLKFLGSTEADLVEELGKTMDELTHELESFSMMVDDLGAFPSPTRPRILWAGVDPSSSDVLERLHSRLEFELDSYDIDRDNHPFQAHITFGRVKSNKGPDLSSIEPELPEGPFGETTVDEVVLYESELSPEGSNYIPRYRSSLDDDHE